MRADGRQRHRPAVRRPRGQQSSACTTQLTGTTDPDGDGDTDGGPATPTTTSPDGTTTTTSPATPGSVQALLDQAADCSTRPRPPGRPTSAVTRQLVEQAQGLIDQARDLQRGGN